jgi:hypothetical protein
MCAEWNRDGGGEPPRSGCAAQHGFGTNGASLFDITLVKKHFFLKKEAKTFATGDTCYLGPVKVDPK